MTTLPSSTVPIVATNTIRPWLRAKVGGLTKDEIIRKLDNTHVGNGLTFKLNYWAKIILLFRPECSVTEMAEEAEFAIARPEDLGFTNGPTTKQLFDEANLAKYGLGLCRPDDGPSLRLAYTDQPTGEWLVVAMKQIRGSNSGGHMFKLERDDSKTPKLWPDDSKLHLDTYGDSGDPRNVWNIHVRLVFRILRT